MDGVQPGRRRPVVDALHRDDAAAGQLFGGLKNAIVGSLIMVGLAMLMATPVAILTGIYLAEYGRGDMARPGDALHQRHPAVGAVDRHRPLRLPRRQVAPSGNSPGMSGAMALAILVVPVVVRTTEDMLALVPHTLREAAFASAPRSEGDRDGHPCVRPRPGSSPAFCLRSRASQARPRRCCSRALSNQFWNTDLSEADGQPAGDHLRFAMSPFRDWQELAWAGVFLITLGVLLLNIVLPACSSAASNPHAEPVEPIRHTFNRKNAQCLSIMPSASWSRRSASRISTSTTATRSRSGYQPRYLQGPRHRLHRPVGLRQVDPAAHDQPHVRPLSRPARRGRSASKAGHPLPRESIPSRCAPRSAAWSSRSRPRSRCRSTTTSPSACACTKKLTRMQMDDRVEWAPTKAALVGRGQGQAADYWHRAFRRPAATSVHCPWRRGQAACAAARRTDLGARPDLDHAHRGIDRRAESEIHHRHRHPQHAAGGARFRFHGLYVSWRIVEGKTDDVSSSRATSAPKTTSPAAWAGGSDHERKRMYPAVRCRPSGLRGTCSEMGGWSNRRSALRSSAYASGETGVVTEVVEQDHRVNAFEKIIDDETVQVIYQGASRPHPICGW